MIAYVDPTGAPVLLCVLGNDAPDAPIRSERRGDLSLASWSDDGRSYLVIGRIPEVRAVAWRKCSNSEFDIRRRMRSARNGRTHVRLTSPPAVCCAATFRDNKAAFLQYYSSGSNLTYGALGLDLRWRNKYPAGLRQRINQC